MKIHEIDGKQYVEVARKAEVGELITPYFTDGYSQYFTEGEAYEVECEDRNGEITVFDDQNIEHILSLSYYRVLEPVESEDELVTATEDNPKEMLDLVGNLARRVTELEKLVGQYNALFRDLAHRSGEKFTAKQVADIIKALGVGAND